MTGSRRHRTKRVHLTAGDLFNLYCTEMGKPIELVRYYRHRGWVDIETLQWITDMDVFEGLGVQHLKYLETVSNN